MAQKWAQGSIAGVELTSNGEICRADIAGGGSLQLQLAGSNRVSANGKTYTQVFETGQNGAAFAVHFQFMPLDLFSQMIAAIRDSLLAGSTFNVTLEDDFQAVDAECTWDFGAGPRGPNYPAQITNTIVISDVTLYFIVTE
jgi:hypothetical protein